MDNEQNPAPADTKKNSVWNTIGLIALAGVLGIGYLGSQVGSITDSSINAAISEAAASAPPAAPEGWTATDTPGVYWRWCEESDNCSSDKVLGDSGYVLALVWCKDRACGDIYGRVNLINAEGVVVGWTNDTAYGDIGQKVQLTFSSYVDSWKKTQLTELNIRG